MKNSDNIMKKITLFSIVLSLGLGAMAHAGEYWAPSKNPIKEPLPQPDPLCFHAGEIHFDVISMYVDPTGSLSGSAGGGFAVGYFFNEYVGVRGTAYWWDSGSAQHNFLASAVLRYPLHDLCIAPYVYGGIGGHFDSENQVGGHLGAGAEYRITDNLGIFADYSYTWADETSDWHGYTLGLRFVF